MITKKIKVLPSQTVFDMSLQYYGSAEGVRYILEDNPGIEIENIAPGDEINIRPTVTIDKDIKKLFNNKIPASI